MCFNLQVTKIPGFAPPPHPTPCLLNTSEYCKKCDAAPLRPPQLPPVPLTPLSTFLPTFSSLSSITTSTIAQEYPVYYTASTPS